MNSIRAIRCAAVVAVLVAVGGAANVASAGALRVEPAHTTSTAKATTEGGKHHKKHHRHRKQHQAVRPA